MKQAKAHLLFLASLLLVAALACNLPLTPKGAGTASGGPQGSPQSSGTAAAPALTASPTVTHVLVPADLKPKGTLFYDVDSSGTAPQHRAPYGDSYNINLFERPFTQKDMNYIASLDIYSFQISSDTNFYYAFVSLIGNDPNDPSKIDYGIEIDKDRDGFGDVLIWAQPPYDSQWTTAGVKVYTDPNHDTGGASPERSDANATTQAPYQGDGYETVVFDQGQGSDPDLAWIRIDPQDPTILEFAFKLSLAGTKFMWGAWADAGLKDPSKFNYNDRFTAAQAGSPIAGTPYYPINAIFAVDNTCRAPFGFNPTGYEPGLCPTTPTPSTKKPGPPPTATLPPIIP
jgi:hypothetical protein